MSDISFGETLFHSRLRASSSGLLWFGVAMLLLGIAAIAFPMLSTLAATVFVGMVLFISGVFMFGGSFSIHGTGPFFAALLFGLLSLAAGVFLLFNPLAGALALTLVMGVMFMFQGAFEVVFAFEMRPLSGWLGLLFSGLASIVIAVIVTGGWPAISLVALGILFGVNFITTGLGYIAASRALK